jgi:acyl carrier protein
MDSYLGGELGIDSREMLEIWYEIEKKLDITVHDYDKRDAYTIQDVVRIFEKQLLVNAEG